MEASNVYELEASPIPQLDGADNAPASDTEKHSKDLDKTATDSWMNDLLEGFNDRMDRTFDRMFQKEEEKAMEIQEALQELHSTLVKVNSPEKPNIPLPNKDLEDESVTFEDVKMWALSQKKRN